MIAKVRKRDGREVPFNRLIQVFKTVEIGRQILSGEKWRCRLEGDRYAREAPGGRRIYRAWDVYEAYFPNTIGKLGCRKGDLCIHHINHDPTDDCIENLELMPFEKHSSMHCDEYWQNITEEELANRTAKQRESLAKTLSNRTEEDWAKIKDKLSKGHGGDPEAFRNFIILFTKLGEQFLVRDCSEATGYRYHRVYEKLAQLVKEDELIVDRMLLNGQWHNVYQVVSFDKADSHVEFLGER